jgi:protein-tyrosine phosphatase
VYDNTGPEIRKCTAALQDKLKQAGIAIDLVVGADIHIAPNLSAQLRSGKALSLNDSRYVLIEPPHHTLPPRCADVFFDLASAGYGPILTHPERMSWIEKHYDFIRYLVKAGVLMQLTAGAILGRFGRRAQYWSKRMLDEGFVHIVATDAHDLKRRPPLLRDAFESVSRQVGETEATNLFLEWPRAILENRAISPEAAARRSAPSGQSSPSSLQVRKWLARVARGG